ncbi:MAG: isopentenyl phosphate kinase family protein [Thermoplasmata archaeon]|nr:MAG: isopentenyl phosphate kinase family protein [Thermoplasmata archaeon]
MQIVKLGGSLITAKRTRKGSRQTPLKMFRAAQAESAAAELARAPGPLVLVHGAGSFGHVKAHKYGLHKRNRTRPPKSKAITEVSNDVRELNLKFMRTLEENGVHGISVPPNVTITNRKGKINSFDSKFYKKYLELDLVPVSFGDLVYDITLGISICSGDDIMYELAKAFKPERAVFAADVDGVYDSDPRINKNARLIARMTPERFKELTCGVKNEEPGIDVTGGMYRKIEVCEAIASLGVECIILNGLKKGRLKKALNGEKVIGTYF